MSIRDRFARRRSGIGFALFSLICLWGIAPLRAETPVLEQLKKQFNDDKGVLRLVVLVSPTCPQCVSGAGWTQEYALKRNPKLDIKVYAVWYEMYPGDSPDDFPEARKLMKDKRVTHYWDQPKDVGRSFYGLVPSNVKGDIEWDAFYLYSQDSAWGGNPDDKPTDLLTWGRTILKDRRPGNNNEGQNAFFKERKIVSGERRGRRAARRCAGTGRRDFLVQGPQAGQRSRAAGRLADVR